MPGMTVEQYQTWRDGKLFASYLNLAIQMKYLKDPQKRTITENELEKITKAMMARPLPTKIGFYKTIADHELRRQYKEQFLSLSKNI
jgi:hypothetical protein